MGEQLEKAFDRIKAHAYQEGIDMLAAIPESDRTARWYYINGYANSCMGNNIIAHDMLNQAVKMEPDNSEYTRLFTHLGGAMEYYEESEYGSGMGKSESIKDQTKAICCDCCECCCLWHYPGFDDKCI